MMTLAEDIALVAEVRQAVGDRMEIMVDANQTNTSYWPRQGPIWTYERALATAREVEALGVVWLEEPLMIDEDGNLPVPQKPGIGVDLNEDWIKKYGQKVD